MTPEERAVARRNAHCYYWIERGHWRAPRSPESVRRLALVGCVAIMLVCLVSSLSGQTPTPESVYGWLQTRLAPKTPTAKSPAANALEVSVTTALDCESTGASTYDLYVGTSSKPPLVAVAATRCHYQPPAILTPATKYYWKAVAKNAAAPSGITSPIWSFTTSVLTANSSDSTPTTGRTILVPVGTDLQAALNAAQLGDTLILTSGALYGGDFVLPAKTGTGVLTITSSSGVAAPNTRATATDALATLQAIPGGDPALKTATGASHYRIVGVRFLANPSGFGEVIRLGSGGPDQNTLATVPTDLVLDRVVILGDPTVGQKRGIALNSGDTKILNSYIAGIRAPGQDSQAIAGWNGPGPYLIDNNYLEAASENIMFGGGDPSIPNLIPSNITITRNYLTKPLAWKTQAGWQVKNLLELKNAANVLIEGDVFEHAWADAQSGLGVLITVRNQDGQCPWCTVRNVEIRYSQILDTASAAFGVLGLDDRGPSFPSVQGTNLAFHDVLIVGTGWPFSSQAGMQPTVISHVTVVGGTYKLLALVPPAMPSGALTIQNIIGEEGLYSVTGSGAPGIAFGQASLNELAPESVFDHNVLERGAGGTYVYPTGNYLLNAGTLAARFDAAYRYSGPEASSDGKPLGADITTLLAKTAGCLSGIWP